MESSEEEEPWAEEDYSSSESEEEEPWAEEDYSSSESEEETYKEEVDPEPPDCYRSYSSARWCEEEPEEDSCDEYNPPKRAEKPISYGFASYSVPAPPRPMPKRKTTRRVQITPESKSIHKHKDAYYSEPKKVSRRTSLSQTEAKKIIPTKGVQQKPITTLEWWEQFKKDYNIGDHKTTHTKNDQQQAAPSFILTAAQQEQWQQLKKDLNLKEEKTEPKQSPKVTSMRREAAPQEATPKTMTRPPETPIQGKSSDFVNSKEPTCYRCHKRGHFAANCPLRKSVKETSLEEKTEKSRSSDSLSHSQFLLSDFATTCPSSKLLKATSSGTKLELINTSDSLVHSDILIPNSRLMHLSLPNSFDPGIREEERETCREEKLQEGHFLQLICPKKNEKGEEEITTVVSPQLAAKDPTRNSKSPAEALVIARLKEARNRGVKENQEQLMLLLAN